MDIYFFNRLDSTQRYLLEALREKELHVPVGVLAYEQYAGVGSRENQWLGERGNFFFSFALSLEALPSDLPLSSASIYFAYLMKKALLKFTSNVWVKWPNDFYMHDAKVGGTITKKLSDVLVCGIGLNLQKGVGAFHGLNLSLEPEKLLEEYLQSLEKLPSWKQVFSEYEVEFELSKTFSVHIENTPISLKEAQLCHDGSLIINKKKVYSLR